MEGQCCCWCENVAEVLPLDLAASQVLARGVTFSWPGNMEWPRQPETWRSVSLCATYCAESWGYDRGQVDKAPHLKGNLTLAR